MVLRDLEAFLMILPELPNIGTSSNKARLKKTRSLLYAQGIDYTTLLGQKS
jgi:hypothetical protein